MESEIIDLVELSRFYGNNKEFVIAGGGNTSFKDDKLIWIKASGFSLGEIDEEGFITLSREKLHEISSKEYSDDPGIREEQVKGDLFRSNLYYESNKRPSVETSLHELIRYRYVVHLHPTKINGILCSNKAKSTITKLFGDTALFVPYIDPGYTLFKKLENELNNYRLKFNKDPGIIFLENHGVFVGADTTDAIKETYNYIIEQVTPQLKPLPVSDELPFNTMLKDVLPAMRMILTENSSKVVRFRHNSLVAAFYGNRNDFNKISLPFTPDIIVYCKARFIYIDQIQSASAILDSFQKQIDRFLKEYKFYPKIIVIKDMGVFAFEDNYKSAETALDLYEDLMKISWYTQSFGGPKYLSSEEIDFIDQWEVENFRRKIAKGISGNLKIENKIVVVTGGAQGIGAGIAKGLFEKHANVILADLNQEEGYKFAATLNNNRNSNHASFCKTDVTNPESVKELIENTVREFGGLDLFISNAEILEIEGLDEMEPGSFSKVTEVNYKSYYYCIRYASEVFKLQSSYKPGYYTDIIQINSKSGLQGNSLNFANAGAKFGGIGLTQSFALELAQYFIKVNAVCPGNFYDGPLWSDPKNGLLVQHLNSGKVPGAKNIDDVKKFYEEKVPLRRGCQISDILKAILYLVEQEYETGQAIPVTGGQIMLS